MVSIFMYFFNPMTGLNSVFAMSGHSYKDRIINMKFESKWIWLVVTKNSVVFQFLNNCMC